MITFILPGYSASNREWSKEVAKNLKLDHEIRPLFWDHWENPDKTFNPKKKADEIIDVLMKDNCNLVAKSVGTLVSAYIMQKISDRISKVILCGIPTVSDERLEIFKSAFADFPYENVVCFQNTKDPWATYDQVKEFMSKVNPKISVIEKPRSDHNYPYFEDFQKFFIA